MPTYEYLCQSCGHEFELFQQITAPVKKKCPACGKPKLQRLIGTGAGVIFKGGGFYETDYRSESYKKAAEAETKSAEPSAKDGKAEPKSDATAPADPTKPTQKAGETAQPKSKKPRSGAKRTKSDSSTSSP